MPLKIKVFTRILGICPCSFFSVILVSCTKTPASSFQPFAFLHIFNTVPSFPSEVCFPCRLCRFSFLCHYLNIRFFFLKIHTAAIQWKYNIKNKSSKTFVGQLLDNALTIHDYNGFNIWINDKKAATNVAANDGKWHHMAFTWKSSTGQWHVYKDGSKVRSSSSAFQQYQV